MELKVKLYIFKIPIFCSVLDQIMIKIKLLNGQFYLNKFIILNIIFFKKNRNYKSGEIVKIYNSIN